MARLLCSGNSRNNGSKQLGNRERKEMDWKWWCGFVLPLQSHNDHYTIRKK